MSLPLITAPTSLPDFLEAGHAIDESALFAPIKPATGHRRMRRLYTVPERTVDVSWLLSNAQMVVLDDWFENALRAGGEFFAAQVKDQSSPLILWWRAKWLTPYKADAIAGGYWRVTGQLRLFETGSTSGPLASALAVAFTVPLTGSAALTVPQTLSIAFSIGLTTSQSLGDLSFGAELAADTSLGSIDFKAGLFVFASLGSVNFGAALEPVQSDPTFANNSLLAHFDGANASAVFVDSGPLGLTLSASGNAQISTSGPRFGSGAYLGDGASSAIDISTTAGFGFGTGAWTVEAWVKPNTVSVEQGLVDFRPGGPGAGFFYFTATGQLAYYDSSTVRGNTGTALVANTWQAVAWTYDGTTMRAFLGGALVWSATFTPDFGSTRPAKIGANFANSAIFDGRVDELRIKKGVALYTASYTPATVAFPDN
jgi:Concanavalin A-like lectin/glucanases superfamily